MNKPEIIGYKETFINEDGAHQDHRTYLDKPIQVENIKLPLGKKRQRGNERIRRIFKQYARAYEAVNICRPEFVCIVSGKIQYKTPGVVAIITEKRMKELTQMLRNRATM